MESPLAASLIGLVGVIIAATIGAWAVLRARRPPPADVELLDVSVSNDYGRGFGVSNTPLSVVDLKLRNRGGESAVLKRMIVEVLWSAKISVLSRDLEARSMLSRLGGGVAAPLPPSAVYYGDDDAVYYGDGGEPPSLPPPAIGPAQILIDISQVIAPGDADRFQVRLQHGFSPRGSVNLLVYLLQLSVLYNADDRPASFRPLLVASSRGVPYVPGSAELSERVRGFQQDVQMIRRRIDQEMRSRGLPVPDWAASPPRRPGDLPFAADMPVHAWNFTTSQFWDPQRAIKDYLDDAERICNQIIERFPSGLHDELDAAISQAQQTRLQFPALRAET